jgi:anti-sigma factor RsiW
MMCAEARTRLLEADSVELRGEGDSELALHLRSCPACTRVAAALLEEQGNVARALAARRPGVPVEIALDHAQAEVATRRRRRAVWRAGIPALAAAGLAGVILVHDENGRSASPVSTLPVVETWPPTPEVQPPPGRNLAVFVADDRDLVIVWFY